MGMLRTPVELAAKFEPARQGFEDRIVATCARHPWLQAIAIGAASFLLSGIGFSLSTSAFLSDNLAVCWPLVGLQAAALLRIPRRHWLAVLTGMVLSQWFMDRWAHPDEVIVETASDVVEVLIAAFTLPAFNGLPAWIRQPRLLQRFMTWPMILGPALTAFPVAAVFSHELHIGFWRYWARWFTGDVLGIVLWLPLGIVMLSRDAYQLFHWKALPRTVCLIGSLSLGSWAMFRFHPTPIAFLLMPLLLIIALKLGFSGSVIAVNLLSIVCARGTLHHLGPFGAIAEPYNVTLLQLFLATCMIGCFPISIILLERDQFEREILEAYARMEQLAISDALTGLANRRHFDTVFDQEWRRALRDGKPLAVMMIDVDCFKLFNDAYGHPAGDECLRQIGNSIRMTVERAGDFAARYGGEEFVVLMSRTDRATAQGFAEILRAQVEQLQLDHRMNPHRIITISIGCSSVVPRADLAPESLIEAADQGLYLAKQGGRNRVGVIEPGALRTPLKEQNALAGVLGSAP